MTRFSVSTRVIVPGFRTVLHTTGVQSMHAPWRSVLMVIVRKEKSRNYGFKGRAKRLAEELRR